MADPVIINPTLTLAGQQAALAASNQGVSLSLTHVSFGTGKYDPIGTEVAMKTPVSSKVTLAGGSRPTPYQLRMLAAWRENIGGEVPITEIGYWAGTVLAFVWSTVEGKVAFTKTDGVTAVHFNDLALSSVPASSITIQIDPQESEALAALAAHEGASNAHPDYVKHSLFPDAQADLWAEIVGGSANAILLTMPTEIVLNAYRAGQLFRFRASYPNTGTVTVNINGLGVKPVVKSGGNALIPSDLKADSVYDLIYDGTRFQLNGGVGGGQFYIEYPTTATAGQTAFKGTYTPGSMMVFVGGDKLPQSGFTATDGQNVTLKAGVTVGTVVTIVALSTFAVADTYTKGEYQSFAATQAQARDKASVVLDRWMSPQRTHEAITARVQASLYDATAGALLVPGSFGAGATLLAASANINTLTATGTYGWGIATVGRPVDQEYGEVIHLTGDTAAYASQLVTSHLTNRMWLRRKNNNLWATVELFHDGNQLALGTKAATARTALELGTAAGADLTTSATDTTVGRVLRVGDFGIGMTDLVDFTGDLNTLTATGFYFASGAYTNGPAGLGAGQLIVMTNSQKYSQQIFMPQSSTRMLQRSSNDGAWTAWTESWTSNNMVKTASNADSTIGRMLQVGDFGLGSKNLLTNNLIATTDDPALPNGMYAVSNTTTGTKPATYGILLQQGRQNLAGAQARVSQSFIDVDQSAYPKTYSRVYISATSTWGAWVETWHTGNLAKTLSQTDTTAGSLLKVGDFGLGVTQTMGANPMATGTNLNDVIVSGMYGQGQNTNATLALNYPVAKAGTLLVQRGSQTIVTQKYTEYDTGREWTRSIYNGVPSVWAMLWDTVTLEKTVSTLDSNVGRMMKVGDFGLGNNTGVKWTFATDADWSKPGGWSGFINVAASKANGVTFPVISGFTSNYVTWTILGRRDAEGGYTGILIDYGSGRAWIGFATISANGPTFRDIYNTANTSTFIQSLMDDADQAAAQATLGISGLINGITTKNLTSANVTLTAAEASVGVLWLTGTLTANVSVIVPSGTGIWSVFNRTAGNFTVTVRAGAAANAGVLIEQGRQSQVVCNGTTISFGQSGFGPSYFDGEVVANGPNCVRMIDPANKYGAIWRNDGGALYLLLTALNDPEGNFNDLRPLTVNLSTALVGLANGATVLAPAARDNSTRVPSTNWVQSEITFNSRRYYGVGIGAPANYTLTASETGRWLNATKLGMVVTLPVSSTIGDGNPFLIRNLSGGEITISHPSNQIQQEWGVAGVAMTLAKNEWVELTSSGTSYWVTARGKVEEVVSLEQLGDRVGEVTHFAMSTPPAGFLKRNGAAVSRTTYAALFAKIGTTFGAGDGSTTFNLPDSRGSFDRGWDDGRGLDTNRAFGSTQDWLNGSHTHGASTNSAGAHSHSVSVNLDRAPAGDGNAVFGDEAYYGVGGLGTNTAGAHSHTVTVSASGGSESRPHNVAFLPCIKF